MRNVPKSMPMAPSYCSSAIFFKKFEEEKEEKRSFKLCVKEEMEEEMGMEGKGKKKKSNVGLVARNTSHTTNFCRSTVLLRTFFFFFFSFLLVVGKQMCIQGGASDKFYHRSLIPLGLSRTSRLLKFSFAAGAFEPISGDAGGIFSWALFFAIEALPGRDVDVRYMEAAACTI